MKSSDDLVQKIVKRFKEKGYSQVEGYNRFGYVRETPSAVIVSREKGKDTTIPFAKLLKAIEAVRDEHKVYSKGPSALRDYGITHINSPVWSLIHLLSLNEIIS